MANRRLTPEAREDPLGNVSVDLQKGQHFDITEGKSAKYEGQCAFGITVYSMGGGRFRINGWQGLTLTPVDGCTVEVSVPGDPLPPGGTADEQ